MSAYIAMDYFKLFLFVLITNCEPGESITTDNPQIVFTKLSLNEQPQDARTQYTVLANKPMCYTFQNMSITRGWCFDYYNHWQGFDEEALQPMRPCQNVTLAMNTLWKCNVTEDQEEEGGGDQLLEVPHFKQLNYEKPKITKYLTFYFNLHVKGAKSVEVTVNGKDLMFSEADLSVPYDGDTIYFYKNDEEVEIVCKNPHSTGTVHLDYLTKELSNASKSTTLTIQLHSGSNNSYIDCVYNRPTDRFVYRVTFVTSKRIINLNEIQAGNQDKTGDSSALILGSCIGAMLLVLGMAGVACWYARTRIKLIQAPYMTYHSESPSQSSQYAIEWENQYNACYDIPENVETLDPKYHYYAEIDYLTCKPKIDQTETRVSKVYDEPYVQNNGM